MSPLYGVSLTYVDCDYNCNISPFHQIFLGFQTLLCISIQISHFYKIIPITSSVKTLKIIPGSSFETLLRPNNGNILYDKVTVFSFLVQYSCNVVPSHCGESYPPSHCGESYPPSHCGESCLPSHCGESYPLA